MINKICASIDKNHIYHCDTKTIGRQGENICTQLEITLEDCLCDSWVYLHFEKADGTTKVTERLEIIDNKATYEIGNDLLDIDGSLSVFVELHKETGLVWRSSTKTYTVLSSFNGVDQIENKEDFITEAQKILDETSELNEDYKTNIKPEIVAAIETSETALSVAKGANQSLSYGNYETMITAFNNLPIDTYRVGQNILIVTLNVPDLWISAIEEESTPYSFVDDATFTNELKTNGMVKVGYYILSALETQKVDLTEYVKNTDYATKMTPGIFKPFDGYGTFMDGAHLGILAATEELINAEGNNYRPLTSKNYRYAVNRVINDRFVTLTQDEYDKLETKDENTYYDIVEE